VVTVRIIGAPIERSRSRSDDLPAQVVADDGVLLARLTAIVLNWDRPELTTRCVESLVADGLAPGRIVVVDNGSMDGSYEQFQQTLPECVLVRLPTNVGIARAFNIGAARLPGDNYVLLNNDAFVHGPSSVARLVRAVTRGKIGIAAPRLLNEDLTLQASVVALVTPRTAFVGALGLSRLIPNRSQPRWSTHWDHSESRQVEAAAGAVYAVRGDTWRQVGGMTERRWMYGEDLDLCRRAGALGWDVWYEREATFVHVGSSTVRERWSDAARAGMIARSEVATLRAQLPRYQAAVTVLFLAFGAAARWAVLFALRKEKATVFRSMLDGYVSAMRSRHPRADVQA
jgi:N-acetylglucosaminyl-diphospho-decaprenol L-rhamnosyltransferase